MKQWVADIWFKRKTNNTPKKIRPTQEEVTVLVKTRLLLEPATITDLIEELCTGPTETQVRRAAWALIYDSNAVDIDDKLRIVINKHDQI